MRNARFNPCAPSRPFALPPYLVLLPMGFTEPGRSPGLLVSSYLAVSPLPRSRRRKRHVRGGLFSVALSLSGPLSQSRTVGVTHHRALWSPDFPPWHVPGPKLSAGRFPVRPWQLGPAPRRSSRPPRTLTSSYGPRFARTTLGHWLLVGRDRGRLNVGAYYELLPFL